MPAGYDSSGGLFLFGGSWLVVVLALVIGDWDSLVSSSLGYARDDDAREALSKLRSASDYYALHQHV